MRRRLRQTFDIVLLVAFLFMVGLILRDASDTFRKPAYDAAAPTAEKFAKLARWIPANADFDVTVDVPRALALPWLRDRLSSAIAGGGGIAADLVGSLLEHQGTVGLLTIAGTVGEKGAAPKLVILAQGAFDGEALQSAVRTAMAAGRAGLVATSLGWTTLFTESDAHEPFGYLLLDPHHLAVGTQDALTAFYAAPPAAPATRSDLQANAVIFGRATIVPRLAALVPPAIEAPARIEIAGSEDGRISALLQTRGEKQAQDLQMFLEGMRSLLLLEQEQYLALVSLLRGIAIDRSADRVLLSSPLAPLLDLWSPTPAQP